MKFRLLLIASLLMLLTGIGAAAAQDADPNCHQLSESDCALVTAGLTNFATIESFNQDYSISVSASGLDVMDERAPSSLSLVSTGSGPVAVNAEGVALALNMEGSVTNDTTTSGPLNMVAVDGKLYIQTPQGEWIGVDRAEAASADSQLSMVNGLASGALDPAALFGLLAAGGTQTRLADETLDGQAMAVFQFAGSTADLLSSDAATDLLVLAADALRESGNNQLAFALAFLPGLAPFMQGDVLVTRWLGIDDQQVHRVVVSANLTLDMNAMGTMMGNTVGQAMNATPIPGPTPEPLPPIVLDLQFSVDLSGHNATAAPTVPAGAREVSADEFRQLIGGAFGGILPSMGG
jgi:hypothetical protein